MIMLIVIGWAFVLPPCVVLGLLCASKVLGRRSRVTEVTDMSAFARQFPAPLDDAPLASAIATSQVPRRSVGAGY